MSRRQTMTGVWLESGELSVRDELPVPEPPPGEALVRVLLAGICNTDLELIEGYYPYTGVLGHEFVGEVEEGPDELLGRRVVGEINAVCGQCLECRDGRSSHCRNRTVLGIVERDGAFAGYLTLPARNLHPVPDGLSDEAAVFTEPLAAALRIRDQAHVSPDDRVLVVGAGKLGQLVARSLVLTGCDLFVAGRHAGKLERLERRGISTGTSDDIAPRSFGLAVDCTGNPAGFEVARGALRPGGTLVMKSTYAGSLDVDASSLVVDEITVVGSRCGPFSPALELLASGQVTVDDLVEARYPLPEALAAFDDAARPGTLKVLLEP